MRVLKLRINGDEVGALAPASYAYSAYSEGYMIPTIMVLMPDRCRDVGDC